MKKKITCLLLAAFLLLIPISTNVTASDNYSTKLYVNCYDGELNLRDAPSGNIICAYPNGTPVLADTNGKSNNYIPVKIGNTQGWMYYKYLETSSPYNYSSTLYPDCWDGELNLRCKPQGTILGAYPNGTPIQADVSEKMNNYVPVKINNTYGWMYYPDLKDSCPYNYSTTLYTNG